MKVADIDRRVNAYLYRYKDWNERNAERETSSVRGVQDCGPTGYGERAGVRQPEGFVRRQTGQGLDVEAMLLEVSVDGLARHALLVGTLLRGAAAAHIELAIALWMCEASDGS